MYEKIKKQKSREKKMRCKTIWKIPLQLSISAQVMFNYTNQ